VVTSVQSMILIQIHSEVYLIQPYMIMLNCDLGKVNCVVQTL